MPKSRRSRAISLTKTKSKGRSIKEKLVDNIRECIDNYEHIFVLSFQNMRTSAMKDIRRDWKTSRIFLGKNKVTIVALGRREEDEYKSDLHKVSEYLLGNVGIMFTNEPKEDVERYMSSFSQVDYARSGFVATDTVRLEAGELEQIVEVTMVEQLKKLGLPVMVRNARVMLMEDYTICGSGDVLTPEQAKLLKVFGFPMAEFRVTLLCHWTNGIFEAFHSLNEVKRGIVGTVPDSEDSQDEKDMED